MMSDGQGRGGVYVLLGIATAVLKVHECQQPGGTVGATFA